MPFRFGGDAVHVYLTINNENVYQAIGDLGYLLDKDNYLELFGRFSALVARATSAMPSRRQAILSAMGVRERELADRAEIILRS